MKNQQLYKIALRFIKFSILGLINTALNFALFYLFFKRLQINYSISQTLSFLFVNVVTYAANKNWTYRNKSSNYFQQFMLYLTGRGLSLLLGLLFTFVFVEAFGGNPLWAQLYVTVLYVVLNFLWSEIFVFRAEPASIDLYVEKSIYAMKSRRSKKKQTVYVVVPVYRETARLGEKSGTNPSGENFVANKIRQLDRIFHYAKDNLDYRLIFVDDGDTIEWTGQAIQKKLRSEYGGLYRSGRVDVWFLDQMHPEWISTSQKGGAIIAAAERIIREGAGDDDILVYTDADISSNLEQIGLLLSSLWHGADVSVSSRWNEESTVIGRSALAKISSWLYCFVVWLFLGIDLSDMQNGFKAYRMRTVKAILPKVQDLTFSFDTEWLLWANILGFRIEESAIFWIDSTRESKVNMSRDALKMLSNLFVQRSVARNYRLLKSG